MSAGQTIASNREAQPSAAALTPFARLVFPAARSAFLQWQESTNGEPMAAIYVGEHELCFEDATDFGFAGTLVRSPEFQAGAAAKWGAIGWSRACGMLESLIEAGILHHADTWQAPDRHDNRPMPSPLPPAPIGPARSWMDEENLVERLTGTRLDLAWLETVVPVFRTAHLFVDAEGRQIGEANVFPANARIAAPIDWRGCPYAGNRYQQDKPMNASALKAMRQHWRPMMQILALVRSAYLERYPSARAGWTVGHIERLTVCALALPSYLLLNCAEPVANGELHPVLSNLFRVVDGLRTVMHQMLFVPKYEATVGPDEPVDAARVLDYADRNFSFHSDHAVCAGPRFMIEDMLGVVFEGAEPRSGWGAPLEPALDHAVAAIEPAIDYALLGLATYGTVFSLWPAMARTYQQIDALLAREGKDCPAAAIAARFAAHFDALSHRSYIASEAWRARREAVYDDMFAQTLDSLRTERPAELLSDLLDPRRAENADPASFAALQQAFERVASPQTAQELARTVFDFLQRGQRILAVASGLQERQRQHLSRPSPLAPLTLADLNLHNVLMGADVRSVPFLPDELAQVLDLDIAVDAHAIQIVPRKAAAPRVPAGGVARAG